MFIACGLGDITWRGKVKSVSTAPDSSSEYSNFPRLKNLRLFRYLLIQNLPTACKCGPCDKNLEDLQSSRRRDMRLRYMHGNFLHLLGFHYQCSQKLLF